MYALFRLDQTEEKYQEIGTYPSIAAVNNQLNQIMIEYEMLNECVGETRMVFTEHSQLKKVNSMTSQDIWILRRTIDESPIGFWYIRPRYF